jgi:predicted nuclease of predicted toxin-antitoxin system
MIIHPAECRLLTDENIDKEVASFLRDLGFDVLDIKEKALYSLKDIDIIEKALAEHRVIITQDSDFGTLIFRSIVAFYGIIYLRPGHFSPMVHIQTLQHVLKQKIEINTPFMIVAENTGNSIRIRIRKH